MTSILTGIRICEKHMPLRLFHFVKFAHYKYFNFVKNRFYKIVHFVKI